VDYATGLRWETTWPKGYGPAHFFVVRDIAQRWAVKNAYEVIVRDGQRIVYQGRLNALAKALGGGTEEIRVGALGWYVELVERRMRKRWVDNEAVVRLEWPSGATADDQEICFEERDAINRRDGVVVRMAHGDTAMDPTDIYYLEYTMPQGSYVLRVTFDWKTRTGEGINIQMYNVDQSAQEWINGTKINGSGSEDVTLSGGNTTAVQFRWYPNATDTYDQSDYGKIWNLTMYSETAVGQDDIVEDVLAALGSHISVDYDEIADPGFDLSSFVTEGDGFETGDSIIQRLASYGDASLNKWGLCVWDETGTSDGLAKAIFESWPATSDYEYEAHLADLASFQCDESDDALANWVVIKYEDDRGIEQWRTPTDNASLTDAASVSAYGQRDVEVDIGLGNTTVADYVGERYLAYYKDPLKKASFSIVGKIRQKNGAWVPANRVRAGERVKVVDYGGGTVFVLGRTAYDAESGVLSMSPDLPEDGLDLFFAQRGV